MAPDLWNHITPEAAPIMLVCGLHSHGALHPQLLAEFTHPAKPLIMVFKPQRFRAQPNRTHDGLGCESVLSPVSIINLFSN